jgi:hypothetical protein
MDVKYIGIDVHKEAIAIAVMNGEGKSGKPEVIRSSVRFVPTNVPAAIRRKIR